MATDEDAEKELIALSKDQRAFFEKHLPGANLYPYQERMLAHILSGKPIVFQWPGRHGKTLLSEALPKFLRENPNFNF